MSFEVERRATVRGETFVWHEVGAATDAEPVVLWHGFPDGPMSWEAIAEALADAGLRAVAPYLRGYHPDTVVAGRSYGAEALGEDVVAFLDAIEADRAALVGHDWGASMIYTAANLAPDRVSRIVAIAIPHARVLRPSLRLALAVRHFAYFKAPWAEAATRRDEFSYLDKLQRRWAPGWTGPEADAALQASKRLLSDPQVLHEALNYYRELSPKQPRVATARVSVPGLIVYGSNDLGGNLEPYQQTPEAFDAPCELVEVPGAGHWPHLEKPGVVIPSLVEFLT